MRQIQRGFTLIELMIVVSIIGVIAAIGVPVYQNYLIRAQVAEGLVLASGAKAVMAEYYSENGDWPADNAEAGIADMHEIIGDYTEHVGIRENVINIRYEHNSHEAISGESIRLRATAVDGSVSWDCESAGAIESKHLPYDCR